VPNSFIYFILLNPVLIAHRNARNVGQTNGTGECGAKPQFVPFAIFRLGSEWTWRGFVLLIALLVPGDAGPCNALPSPLHLHFGLDQNN
jgi:hypothetical protein